MTDDSAGDAGDDRRQFERYSARIEVRFSHPTDAARAFHAYSLNFSVGGLCIKTQRPYVIGDALRLELVVEAGEPIHVDAEVAWMRAGAVGVRFVNVPGDVRERLAAIANAFTALKPKKT